MVNFSPVQNLIHLLRTTSPSRHPHFVFLPQSVLNAAQRREQMVIIFADTVRVHLQLFWQRVSERLQHVSPATPSNSGKPTARFFRRSDRSSTVSLESSLALVNAPRCALTMVSVYSCCAITFHSASVVTSACLGFEEILRNEARCSSSKLISNELMLNALRHQVHAQQPAQGACSAVRAN
jgi:hypothetical protein